MTTVWGARVHVYRLVGHHQVNVHCFSIPRDASGIVKAAAEAGSFLLVGEPGAGKTGVLAELANQLGASGGDLLVFKVSASGVTGLKSDLGLSHPLRDVLENWPGVTPAYLLVDGLDEARGGPAGNACHVDLRCGNSIGRTGVIAIHLTLPCEIGLDRRFDNHPR